MTRDSGGKLKRFVILTVPRAGSNMLCTLLNSHPDILCHHEIFNEDGIFYALDYRDGRINLGTLDERNRDPLAVYARIWREHAGHATVGFKLNNYQNELILQTVLAELDVKKIVIRRRNSVKAYVSWLISSKLNQWELYRGEQTILPRPKIEVQVEGLLDSIRFADQYYDRIESEMRRTGQAFLTVTYEKLFDDTERRALLNFLEVPPLLESLHIDSVKQNPTQLRKLVLNFEELRAALRGSELESQLLDAGI